MPILDIRILLQTAIFNFLIGNCDAHGKDFSFLYGKRRLAPLYDLVSTAAYEGLSTKLSMSIGGEYRIERVRREHFLRLAAESGVTEKYLKGLIDRMLIQAPEAISKAASEGCVKGYRHLVDRILRQMTARVDAVR